MAAVFLVTLYEYSPLFYIAVVFVCFLVTSGLVLGWFGWDVPVILRNSEETESSVKVSQKQMRQVKNPFNLEVDCSAPASLTNVSFSAAENIFSGEAASAVALTFLAAVYLQSAGVLGLCSLEWILSEAIH